ncbi:MAG: AAA family ATPase [Lysobacterales bacterium]|nr:MAG: AAA family ATPase [Xanthomonadales bacterium]
MNTYERMSAEEFSGALLGALSKREAVAACRARGWSGDDARADKATLCNWLAGFLPLEQREAFIATRFVPAVVAEKRPAAVIAGDEVPAAWTEEQPAAVVAEETWHKPAPRTVAPRDDNADVVAAAIAGALRGLNIKAGIDEDAVRAIVRGELKDQRPIEVHVNGVKAGTVKSRTHPMFEKALRLAGAGVNVLLVGPAGCGKSYMAKQIADALSRAYGTLHCSAGVSESQVTGWLLPVGEGGKFSFVPSQFAALYLAGDAVFLIDEIDAADPNMLTVLNGALANGALHIPQCAEKPEWKRGENVALMAAANTYGTGADASYVGRNQLDAATLDRFYVVQMDYDSALEADIGGIEYKPGAAWSAAPDATAQELRELAAWVLELRERVATSKIRRIISTRTIQKAIAARIAGIPAAEVKADAMAGWTRDELSKVGE